MSYYNNGNAGQQPQGSPGCPAPFMFGGRSYGGPGNYGQQQQRSFQQADTVKSLMSQNYSGSGVSNYARQGTGSAWGGGAAPAYTFTPPSQQSMGNSSSAQPGTYAQPKAYMQVPGQGGSGEYVPLSIPYQIGPSGSQMTMAPLEPHTIKVTAPPGAGADGAPITFQIDPSQYMAMAIQRK